MDPLQLARQRLGDCESWELPRRCLANLWRPPRIGQIGTPHIFEIGLRKTASKLAGQPGSQFLDNFLAILRAVRPLLLLFDDSAANLVVRVDL